MQIDCGCCQQNSTISAQLLGGHPPAVVSDHAAVYPEVLYGLLGRGVKRDWAWKRLLLSKIAVVFTAFQVVIEHARG